MNEPKKSKLNWNFVHHASNRLVKFLKDAQNRIVWILMRRFDVECSLEEVCERRYIHPGKSDPRPDVTSVQAVDKVLEFARETYERAEKRKALIDDKNKVFLGISAILLPLITAIIPRLPYPFVGILPLIFLFVTAYLILIHFGVGIYTFPELKANQITGSEDEIKKLLIAEYYESANVNNDRLDFYVDLFRVARRSLMLGLFFLVVIAIHGAWPNASLNSEEERIVKKLRSDERLINLLRGPKGDPGPPGEPGLRIAPTK